MIPKDCRKVGKYALTAHDGPISRRLTFGPSLCPVCLERLPGGRGKQRYCSPRCRLLAWAVRALAEALKGGRADGLRIAIENLCQRGEA